MDNIQFWLYVAFGVIYFVFKQLRKKKTQEETQEVDQEMPQPRRKPVTFDELLKEFTQGKEGYEEVREEQEYHAPQVLPTAYPQKEIESRKFADDESQKIYERSIAQAEGYDLKFERDDNFRVKSPMQVTLRGEDEEKSIGEEIFDSLRDADQARKAVILGEILNRKY